MKDLWFNYFKFGLIFFVCASVSFFAFEFYCMGYGSCVRDWFFGFTGVQQLRYFPELWFGWSFGVLMLVSGFVWLCLGVFIRWWSNYFEM